jgi:anti-sigma regulatory factor (Ser/Thr protein kinase)
MVSEMVTNAVRHGSGAIRVRISRHCGRLHVEVHDHGPGRPVWRQPTDTDESGRGLIAIVGLADLYGGGFGVEEDAHGDGKTVHAWISLADGP